MDAFRAPRAGAAGPDRIVQHEDICLRNKERAAKQESSRSRLARTCG